MGLIMVCRFTDECYFSIDRNQNPTNIRDINKYCLVSSERRPICYFRQSYLVPDCFFNYKEKLVKLSIKEKL